jgi:hypothetical protein
MQNSSHTRGMKTDRNNFAMSRIESRVGVLDGYVGIGRFQIVIDEQESNAL